MANGLKGEVDLKIGEVTRTIRVTYNALCELETLTKRKTPEILADANEADFVAVRHLLWAGFRGAGDKVITTEEVGDIIQETGMKPIIDAITKSVNAIFDPKSDDAEKVEDENPR